jgi:hypothetical protein
MWMAGMEEAAGMTGVEGMTAAEDMKTGISEQR